MWVCVVCRYVSLVSLALALSFCVHSLYIFYHFQLAIWFIQNISRAFMFVLTKTFRSMRPKSWDQSLYNLLDVRFHLDRLHKTFQMPNSRMLYKKEYHYNNCTIHTFWSTKVEHKRTQSMGDHLLFFRSIQISNKIRFKEMVQDEIWGTRIERVSVLAWYVWIVWNSHLIRIKSEFQNLKT